MNTLQKTVLALLASSFVAAGAQAAVSYGNGMMAEPYIGAKIGQYDLDNADDEATSYGIYGGAMLSPNFGIEAEYLTTSDEDFATNAEYNADVYGLYGTYTYDFPNTGVYAKGRLGIAKNEIEREYSSNVSYEDSDTSVAGGLGLGYHLAPNAAVEVAYDWYPTIDDVNGISSTGGTDLDASGFTLGANFRF